MEPTTVGLLVVSFAALARTIEALVKKVILDSRSVKPVNGTHGMLSKTQESVAVIKTKFDELEKELSKHFEEDVESSRMLRSLYEQHNRFDEDGKPIWYLPRSVVEDVHACRSEIGKMRGEISALIQKIK